MVPKCVTWDQWYLPEDRPWWDKKMQFDRNKDKRDAPKCQKGEDILNELESLRPIAFGKVGK